MIASEKKILILGSRLAGLACAIRLHEAGARPLIFERSDGVGGRVRTDPMDGFLLDRGFQVFLDAYLEAGDLLDKESLDLRAFKPGALIYQTSGLRRIMDVLREPRHLIESIFAPICDDKIVGASLSDHLADIYRDLKDPSIDYDNNKKNDAVWSWKLIIQGHCGDHIVDSVRAIHRLINDHMPTQYNPHENGG